MPRVPVLPIGEGRRRVERETPGRRSDFESSPKPAADETEWRSAVFAHHRHTADGNSYQPGDPIPLAEAIRQGQVNAAGERNRAFRIPSCPRCKGTGKRGQPKGHKPNCSCPFCTPCSLCGGSGFASTVKEGRDASNEEEGSRTRVIR